ncbi:bestrophin-2 [Onthophagus taurus]|uniref:bestrophin-2 n=1 Tax=Onthophagus taurus TaxID=166361 RepID=UPI0039BE7BF4
MTVTYTGEVPNGSTFGCFWKILRKWRGSVYKLVWRELLAYLFLYYSINFICRYALSTEQKRTFDKIRVYFSQQSETIPMSFVLGFYVSLVVKRWWEQYKLLPWPDTLALFVNAGIPGMDEKQRLMRRNIVRYAVLAYVITLQRVSLRVKKRFPSWQHVVDSGLMLESERKIFELMDGKTPMSKYWMPLVWATNIINRARKESVITSDHIVQTLLIELSDIRRRLGALIGYDTVCVPLVYTQVVTLALYAYFIAALMGRQFLPDLPEAGNPMGKYEEPVIYFPFFTALQFFFYVGWLKVAEVLINPFGEDDDDIELNWLIDRHIKASYMIVDEMHQEHPELLKDQYWDEVVPKELPYTVASEHYRREEPKGSAENYKVKAQDALYANLIGPTRKVDNDMYADYESVDTPIVERRKSSNWFTRQISRTRLGSVRSASTAYSSGGLFGRHRGNSVYASPEAGLPGVPPQKTSIYDKLTGKNQRHATKVKSRPRIPTPEVTKDVDKDNHHRLPNSNTILHNSMSSGVTLTPHQFQTNYLNYPDSDGPLVQVVLSPIQELDSSSSVNTTLLPGQPGTAALAQAVLSPGLGPVLTGPVGVPITVPQLSTLGLAQIGKSPLLTRHTLEKSNPAFIQAFGHSKPSTPPETHIKLLEVQSDEEGEQHVSSRSSNSSKKSEGSNVSKESKESQGSTASISSKNSLEVTKKVSNNTLSSLTPPNGDVLSASNAVTNTISTTSDDRLRKTSTTSQSTKDKREVYV